MRSLSAKITSAAPPASITPACIPSAYPCIAISGVFSSWEAF